MALGDLPTGDEKRVRVRDMFDRIAPRYDALNRVMSGGMDQRWRRRALDKIEVAAGDLVVDLACGTGDLCELVESRGASVVGVDFALQMLKQGRQRGLAFRSVQGDGEWLPFRDASVDVVTCGFALRNFVSLEAALREVGRILKPGGRAALIDVDRPAWGPVRAAHAVLTGPWPSSDCNAACACQRMQPRRVSAWDRDGGGRLESRGPLKRAVYLQKPYATGRGSARRGIRRHSAREVYH